MQSQIEITNSQALRAIDRLAQLGLNPTPMLDVVGNNLANKVRLCFRKGQTPGGNKWPRIKHRDGQPLRDTGRLQRSITHQVITTGQEHELLIGTNVVYAPLHQFGGKGMKVTVGAHTRRITQAFGKPLKFPVFVNVNTHRKRLNVKPRPFLPTNGLPPSWEQSASRAIMRALDWALEA
jgi:phage gpG-like protein